MRILLLGDIRPVHLKRWRGYFRERGHEVAVVSLERDPLDQDYICLCDRVPVQSVKYYLKKGAVAEFISRFSPDLVNAHFIPGYGLLAVASGFHPVAVTAWGSDVLVSPRKSWLHRARALWVLRRCDLITSDSNYMTHELRSLGSFDTEIVTEPMGVLSSTLRSLSDDVCGRNLKEVLIVSTRRLEPLYRVETLLRALHSARDKLRPFRCMICGEGSQRDKLESMARDLDLSEIEFTGWKMGDEYIQMIRAADLYVSCSESDSTSVSLIEAMAAGAFPVVSDIPGNREWVRDGESALMFPVGDAEALASKLIEAVDNRTMRQTAASINLTAVQARAVWEENMGRIERAFEELVSRTKR